MSMWNAIGHIGQCHRTHWLTFEFGSHEHEKERKRRENNNNTTPNMTNFEDPVVGMRPLLYNLCMLGTLLSMSLFERDIKRKQNAFIFSSLFT